MYRVIARFSDLLDGGHVYHEGDMFPRQGATATAERIAELKGTANRQNKALIAEVNEEKQETETRYVFQSVSGAVHTVELSPWDGIHDAVTLDGETIFYLIQEGMGELP